jgi:membrane protease YdiL (CAAX protease family)
MIGVLVYLLAPMPEIPRNLEEFSDLQGNGVLLLGWLAFNWLFVVIIEEVIYRGYMINRFIDLLGDHHLGWITGLLISSALFGMAHLALQDIGGAISTFISGLAFGGIYLIGQRRNLWLPILVHGSSNTFAFLGVFLGWLG